MGYLVTEADPATKSQVEIKLFRKVENVAELRKKIISGDLKCTIIKPTLILNPFQIVVAANKALIAEEQKRLVTKSVYNEILFNLSTSKNVTKSLTLFGIDDRQSDILIVTVKQIDSDGITDVYKSISGQETDLDDLENITDMKLIKKAYNITDEEEKSEHLLDIIVNKIVTKEC